MDDRPSPTLEQEIAAALDWWREAGVDRVFEDDSQVWLAEPGKGGQTIATAVPVEAPPVAPKAEPKPAIGGDRALWPEDLAAFRTWWLSEPSLASGDPAARVPPSGSAGAALMVLVPMPEAEDRTELLTGRAGALVRAFAAAAGIAPGELYLASALPRHMAMPDWNALAEAGLGEIVRHHCRLAAPRRLLVLGQAILPLFGHDPAQAGLVSLQIDIGAPLPALTGYAPERLLEHARLRAGLWHKWLDWTDESAG